MEIRLLDNLLSGTSCGRPWAAAGAVVLLLATAAGAASAAPGGAAPGPAVALWPRPEPGGYVWAGGCRWWPRSWAWP
jgi:hypothetical protein